MPQLKFFRLGPLSQSQPENAQPQLELFAASRRYLDSGLIPRLALDEAIVLTLGIPALNNSFLEDRVRQFIILWTQSGLCTLLDFPIPQNPREYISICSLSGVVRVGKNTMLRFLKRRQRYLDKPATRDTSRRDIWL